VKGGKKVNISRLDRLMISAISLVLFGMIQTPERCLAQTAGGGATGFASRVKSRDRNAPTRESRSAIGLGTKYLNGILGGLRHGAGATFGIEATTADKIPAVEFRVTALVSTKLYRRFELEAYLPTIGDDRTHADIWFSYTRRTRDNFFGIGTLAPKIETNFDLEQRSLKASFYRDFTDDLQAGVYAQVTNSATYRGRDDKDLPIDQLFSGDPGVVPTSRWTPGLQTNTKILSYGLFAEYDRRDNSRGLTRGAYLYGRVESADSLNVDRAFSDYGWIGAELDGRTYFPLGGDKTSLAVRAFGELKSPKRGSQIPFYNLSFLGGRSYVRGYETLRYRGNNLLAFSAELRQTVAALREDRGVDVIVFGDAGQVWGDNRSKTDPTIINNDEFDSGHWRAGFGGGLQYRYSKRLASRAEIGKSSEGTRFYFSVSRGF
jgi:outer membrane protein assembly factor BamA